MSGCSSRGYWYHDRMSDGFEDAVRVYDDIVQSYVEEEVEDREGLGRGNMFRAKPTMILLSLDPRFIYYTVQFSCSFRLLFFKIVYVYLPRG